MLLNFTPPNILGLFLEEFENLKREYDEHIHMSRGFRL